MSLIQALLLGLLQGATEFLPVSSSGHLVLVPWLLRWPAPGLAYDALVHWGTVVAVVGYFWREWAALLTGAWRALRQRSLADPHARLLALLVLGTVPGALLGWLLEGFFEAMFDRPVAAAGFLLVTAAVLTLSERLSSPERGVEALSWGDALVVGLAQAAAILPGISRSGMTIAAGMGRGLRREAAARFSFLLSTPIILGAGLLQMWDLVQAGELAAQAPTLAVGFLGALVAGLVSIHYLLRYLQRRSLYPFALYCGALGLLGLAVALL
ncbi:MAG TPA: undecaprenyl-diphosphate phosphatase [Chloroflexi bacterium]|nr:undecaprenyl-diphosphate phosphatase [Chloroflexota bacterium]